MFVLFLILIIYLLFNIKYHKNIDKDYLNKNNTVIVNALFVIIVFYSHFSQYIGSDFMIFDKYFFTIVHKIGQLMVTTFLFFSGYGIYECIKNKKDYISKFGKNRFLKTYCNFVFAVLLFVLLNLIIGNKYSLSDNLLSFVGIKSIGNSNWYMLATFEMYAFILFAFNLFEDKKKSLILVTILSIAYSLAISYLKEPYWGNTVLCFSAGMWYSYFKEDIDKKIKNKNYLLYLGSTIIIFLLLYFSKHFFKSIIVFNFTSIFFVLIIVLLLMKFSLKGKYLIKIGELTFWIYILQRLPMIFFQNYGLNNILYFYISFVITIILSLIINKYTNMFWNKVLKK